ncbi:hypothetical protein GCM10009863_66050 [Streptomyces axinellae]|uniref:Uncharacterized protein n=1 Tax=Streptomyces axinellae TaxID=552788 RepID=A0ABN3R0N6_9ACTN
MEAVCGWHASPRKEAEATTDSVTGEIRVPLSLFKVDQRQGDAPLVLSRREAEALHARLGYLLAPRLMAAEAAEAETW